MDGVKTPTSDEASPSPSSAPEDLIRGWNRESLLALLAAGLVIGGLLLASTVYYAVDLPGLQASLEKIFSVQAPPPPPQTSRYNQEDVARKRHHLLNGQKKKLFQAVQSPALAPQASMPAAGALPARQKHTPETMAAPEASPVTDSNVELQRVGRSAEPTVIARRSIQAVSRFRSPDPAALYGTGRESGGGPGRPGASRPPFQAEPFPERTPRAQDVLPAALAKIAPQEFTTPLLHQHVQLTAQSRPVYPTLDHEVTARFDVTRTPGSDLRTFRLTIALRPESTLSAMPKDVLFLIDTSRSVKERELFTLRDALLASLERLGPDDRWNVATFSETIAHFAPRFQAASDFPAQRSALHRFIRKNYDEGNTNVYLAVQNILEDLPRSRRPINVLLASDGEATQGVHDVKSLVGGFQRVRRDNFAIHSFNAGSDGNDYLLQLLSYRSRGFYRRVPELADVPQDFPRFWQQFEQPVLTHAVLSYTNLNPQEVYPGVLPNLYRHHPIVITGRGKVGDRIVLRIAGFHAGQAREFYFRATLPEQVGSQPEILAQWAQGKAHALMAQLSQEPKRQDLVDAITDLAKRYDLETTRTMLDNRNTLSRIKTLFRRK